MFRVLADSDRLDTYGTLRDIQLRNYFAPDLRAKLVKVDNLESEIGLIALLDRLAPNVVINCTSLSRKRFHDLKQLFSVFSVLPLRLHHLCSERNIRLIHIGTDGVFSGKRGCYTEDDPPDSPDPYGIAKFLGEVTGPRSLTLRTSMLGPELATKGGLLSWFLSQETECRCYTRAIFSGLPTVILSEIVRDVVLANEDLVGVYHVSAEPISKFDLLTLVGQHYGKQIQLIPDDSIVIDRSLSSERFREATGYTAPSWSDMVERMRTFSFGLRKY